MRNTSQKFTGIREDILGAGFHLLQGAGGDLKLLVQQAVQRMVGEGFVTREAYERLEARVARLEGKTAKKPTKTGLSAKKPAARKKPAKARK